MDIGCFRESEHIENFVGFPDSRRFVHDKVTFNIVGYFVDSDKVDLKIDSRFAYPRSMIVGGIFAGGIEALLKFADLHYKTIDEAIRINAFAGFFLLCYCYFIVIII